MMSDSTPRFFGQKDFVVSNGLPAAGDLLTPSSGGENSVYLQSLLLFTVIGIILAVIAFFAIWIFFIARRCCRTGCGGRDPQPYGYTSKQRWGPFAGLLVSSLLAVGLSIFGFFLNANFSVYLTSTDRGITHRLTDGVLDSAVQYVSGMNDRIRLIGDSTADTALALSLVMSGSTDHVPASKAGVDSAVAAVSGSLTNLTVVVPARGTANETAFAYVYGTTAVADFVAIGLQINQTSDALIRNTTGTANQISASFIAPAETIRSAAASTSATLQSALDRATEYRSYANDYFADAKERDSQRYLVVFIVLFFPGVSLLLIVFGGFTHLSSFFKVNFIWLYFTLVVYWLLWSAWMPASMFVGDVCNFIAHSQTDYGSLIGADAGRVVDACLLDTSIIEATNAGEALAFASNITFPAGPNRTAATPFVSPATLLTDYHVRVNALTLWTAFHFNTTIADDELAQLNEMSAPPTNYTRATVSDCDPSTYPSPAEEDRAERLRDDILWRIDAEYRLDASLYGIRANVSALHTTSDAFYTLLYYSDVSVGNMSSIMAPLLNAAAGFTAGSSCAAIGVAYGEASTALCTDFSPVMGYLAACLFFIAVLSWPNVIISTILSKRMDHPGDGIAPPPTLVEGDTALGIDADRDEYLSGRRTNDPVIIKKGVNGRPDQMLPLPAFGSSANLHAYGQSDDWNNAYPAPMPSGRKSATGTSGRKSKSSNPNKRLSTGMSSPPPMLGRGAAGGRSERQLTKNQGMSTRQLLLQQQQQRPAAAEEDLYAPPPIHEETHYQPAIEPQPQYANGFNAHNSPPQHSTPPPALNGSGTVTTLYGRAPPQAHAQPYFPSAHEQQQMHFQQMQQQQTIQPGGSYPYPDHDAGAGGYQPQQQMLLPSAANDAAALASLHRRQQLQLQHFQQQQQLQLQQQTEAAAAAAAYHNSPLTQYKDSYHELQLQHALPLGAMSPAPAPAVNFDSGYAPGQVLESNAQAAAPVVQYVQPQPQPQPIPQHAQTQQLPPSHEPVAPPPQPAMAQTQPFSQYNNPPQPVAAETVITVAPADPPAPAPAAQSVAPVSSPLAAPVPAPQPLLQQPHTPAMHDDEPIVLNRRSTARPASSLYPPPPQSAGDIPASPNTDPDRLIQLHDDGVQLASIKRAAPAGGLGTTPEQSPTRFVARAPQPAAAAAAAPANDDDAEIIIPVSRGGSSAGGGGGAAGGTAAPTAGSTAEPRLSSASKNAPLALPTASATGTPLKRPIIVIPKRTPPNKVLVTGASGASASGAVAAPPS